MIVEDSTANQAFLRSAAPGTAVHEVYEKMEENPSYSFQPSAANGLALVEQSKDTLFFTSTWFVKMNANRFMALKSADSISGMVAWGFQKNSQFTELFNYHLFKLQQVN